MTSQRSRSRQKNQPPDRTSCGQAQRVQAVGPVAEYLEAWHAGHGCRLQNRSKRYLGLPIGVEKSAQRACFIFKRLQDVTVTTMFLRPSLPKLHRLCAVGFLLEDFLFGVAAKLEAWWKVFTVSFGKNLLRRGSLSEKIPPSATEIRPVLHRSSR